ncbi:PPOX class F420-dependent oxidoreductase [Agrococcus sp. SGAir0287]|uniref:PPOX class F420-dependent oxidoreductase n=1 Tax=Agrococcus sp. SGAir0287 TaxID=2070347 RepID=UPI0010CD24E4|nr:PPOX class F420-dependent oxidoreductase [Agrococcus sp. SGAir0287]QCR18810.1 PPOX class F420-dependent oxidoreductase [Agrococcus sp. SGAir0287]
MSAPSIPDEAADLLEEPNVAALATIEPDGSPQVTAVWVGRDGDTLLIPMKRHLRKTQNIRRDPRVSVLVTSRADPEHFLEVRGTVELVDDPTSSLATGLAVKYDGAPLPPDDEGHLRMIARVTPTRVRVG